MDEALFFLIALPLALLLAVSEVAAAFTDKPHTVRAVFSPWALPFYALYLLLTFLMGKVLIEQLSISLNWTSAIALGLMGPALFKTQTKLFRPISGDKGELNANLERIISGLQQFCFAQISIALARHRLALKERRAEHSEDELLHRLRTVAGSAFFEEKLKPLIDERRERDPATLRLFLVELILQQDPHALDQAPAAPAGAGDGASQG